MTIVDNVKNEIRTHRLFSHGDTLVVGVSGGADSIALLLILNSLQHEYGLKLIAAHFNHNLRSNSKTDEGFVKRICDKLNIVFESEVWQLNRKKTGHVSEDLAREKRFNFFYKIVKKYKADAIVLAHTLDDVAETVLMRILRGSGLAGIRSIMPVSEFNGHRIVRPLLRVSRREVEQFLQKNRQSFRQDLSNFQEIYFRNKIRLNLIPLLQKSFSPQIKELLANLAESVVVDYAYLEQCAQKKYDQVIIGKQLNGQLSLKLSSFIHAPQAVQRMMLRLAVKNLKGNLKKISLKHVLEVQDLVRQRPVGSIVNWPDGIVFKKEKNRLVILRID